MWKYNNIDELYHFGILGMRWGHRKSKEPKKNWKYHKKELAKAQYEYAMKADKVLSKEKNLYLAQKKVSKIEQDIANKYKDSLKYYQKREKRIKNIKRLGTVAAVAAIAGLAHYNKNRNQKILQAKRAMESERLNNLMRASTSHLDELTNMFA